MLRHYLLGRRPRVYWPVFKPVLFSLFSAFSVTSVLNPPFFSHRAPRPPSQTSATSPLPSAQSIDISLAVSPPPSAAPIRCASTSPAGDRKSTRLNSSHQIIS